MCGTDSLRVMQCALATINVDGCMIVRDIAGFGSGPVEFQDGTPSSGLSYTFVSLASADDDLEFSSDGGVTFGYSTVRVAVNELHPVYSFKE